jgi:hypothetical protein
VLPDEPVFTYGIEAIFGRYLTLGAPLEKNLSA